MKRPISSYVLIFLLLFQLIGALPAGLSMIIDPSGSGMGIPLYILQRSPFSNFFIPGLFLFIVLGLFPIFIFLGLLKKPKMKWTRKLNLYKQYHWALTFSYYLGIVLVVWINMQFLFGVGFSVLHFIYTIVGLLIIIFSQWPSTKRYYLTDQNLKG